MSGIDTEALRRTLRGSRHGQGGGDDLRALIDRARAAQAWTVSAQVALPEPGPGTGAYPTLAGLADRQAAYRKAVHAELDAHRALLRHLEGMLDLLPEGTSTDVVAATLRSAALALED